MSSDGHAVPNFVCPNCRALNQPNIRVCISCGADQVVFRAAQAQLQTLQADHAHTHEAELQATASETVEYGVAEGRRKFASQFRWLLAMAAVCAILIVAGTAYHGYQLQLRRERLGVAFIEAKLCLQRAAFVCARDGFAVLVAEEPDYPQAQQSLRDARLGLAREHVLAARWEAAIVELDAVIEHDPHDEQARVTMKDVYDRWYKDALGRGEFITALSVKLQRDARFP